MNNQELVFTLAQADGHRRRGWGQVERQGFTRDGVRGFYLGSKWGIFPLWSWLFSNKGEGFSLLKKWVKVWSDLGVVYGGCVSAFISLDRAHYQARSVLPLMALILPERGGTGLVCSLEPPNWGSTPPVPSDLSSSMEVPDWCSVELWAPAPCSEDMKMVLAQVARWFFGHLSSTFFRSISLLIRCKFRDRPRSDKPPLLLCKLHPPLKPPYSLAYSATWGWAVVADRSLVLGIIYASMQESHFFLVRFIVMVLNPVSIDSLMKRPPSPVEGGAYLRTELS
ncbi:hypothetical protein V6N13_134198 [Hibiscus sabdariffa]|uniref:Uncharacterized protein n=1 Tax=Hibiscus sabdariffa TaxID=183260 RepID=A0ABR2R339_9ROSI